MTSRRDLEVSWIGVIRDFILTDGEMNSIVRAEHSSGNDTPRPTPPYMTVKMISGPRPVGNDYRGFLAGSFKQRLFGQRAYTVSLQTFGQGGQEALDKIVTLLESPIVLQELKNRNIGISSRGAPVDVSALLQVGFENRASLDIGFVSVSQYETGVETVETVEISGNLKKADDTSFDTGDFDQDGITPPPNP